MGSQQQLVSLRLVLDPIVDVRQGRLHADGDVRRQRERLVEVANQVRLDLLAGVNNNKLQYKQTNKKIKTIVFSRLPKKKKKKKKKIFFFPPQKKKKKKKKKS